MNAPLRSDVSFNEMIDVEHHTGPTPLSRLGVGLVTQVVLDYMHLVCLGVTKRLVSIWMKGPLLVRQGNTVITAISQNLELFKNFTPSEFTRRPRSLLEVARWKATEFRQFLLYTGIVALFGQLPAPMYDNFMILSVAVHILLHPTWCQQYNDYAKQLLSHFVEHFSQLYGRNMLVYNVHNLIHLADDAKLYGPLDNVSAFPFENFMRHLLRGVRKPSSALQQVIKRWYEESAHYTEKLKPFKGARANKEHNSGPVPEGVSSHTQYKELQLEKFCIRVCLRDNCVSFGNEIGLVQNILSISSEMWIVFQAFEDVDTFFKYPCDSNFLGIFTVDKLSQVLRMKPVADITSKNVILPHRERYIIIPMFHSMQN